MRIRMVNVWSVALGAGLWLSVAPGVRATAATQICPAPLKSPQTATFHIQQGFAVRQIITDRVLHQTWALVEDCSHPERPLQMISLVSSEDEPLLAAQTLPAAANSPRSLPKLVQKPVFAPISMPFHVAESNSPVSSTLFRPVLVRAGDRVHLWSSSTNVRMEIEAVALDYGHAGQVIHLRRIGNDHAQTTTMLAGLVDGADSAELLP